MLDSSPQVVNEISGNQCVRLCEVKYDAGCCGFNVTRSRYDPYPWVSTVEAESPAAAAGVQPGDCLLEVNGDDMLGLRVADVATRVRARGDKATLMLWNAGVHPECNSETLCCGPMPRNLQRLIACVTSIVDALECPICLEMTSPPTHQCVNGHIICHKCRIQTDRCPVCRVKLFRGRSLIADQVFHSLVDAFELQSEDREVRAQLLTKKIYGSRTKGKKQKSNVKISFLSPTNKFLSRLIGSGKSSSAENLSSQEPTNASSDTNASGLKAKSLSSSEISKASSFGSTFNLSYRPGSGLLEVPSRRPASYHGSAEDLKTLLTKDIDGFITSSPQSQGDICIHCPIAPACNARIPPCFLKRHLFEHHDFAIIQYHRSSVILEQRLLQNAIVVLYCFNTVFYINLIPSRGLWIWTIDDTHVQYTATLKVDTVEFHCDVLSLLEMNIIESDGNIPWKTDFDQITIVLEVHKDAYVNT